MEPTIEENRWSEWSGTANGCIGRIFFVLAFHQAPHVGTCANTVVGASLPGATMEVCLLLVMLDDTAAEVACTRNQEADQFLGNQRINQRDAKDG